MIQQTYTLSFSQLLIGALSILVIALVLGFLCSGFIFGSKAKLKKDLKALQKKQDEYEKNMVTHFEESSAIMKNIGDNYKKLCSHFVEQVSTFSIENKLKDVFSSNLLDINNQNNINQPTKQGNSSENEPKETETITHQKLE